MRMVLIVSQMFLFQWAVALTAWNSNADDSTIAHSTVGVVLPASADTALANALMAEGRSYVKASKLDSAILSYAQAKKIYHKLAHDSGAPIYWQALVKCHNRMAGVYRRWGKFPEAHAQADSAIQICTERSGEDQLGLAQSYLVKGILYSIQEQHDKALQASQQSLEIRLKELPSDDPLISDNYNLLAIIYTKMEDFEQALKMHEKALAIRKKHYGENHALIAATYNNMAIIYNEIGKNREALNYHTMALNMKLSLGREETNDIADSYNGLGLVYQGLGDYDKAIENLQKALAIKLKIFGADHLEVAGAYHNLGGAYSRKWDFENTRKYYEQALEITRAAFGENYPQIADIYSNLGGIFRLEGDYQTSLEYMRRALTIYLKVFGEDHSEVANVYSAMGVVYDEKGKYDDALQFYEKALKIDLKVFGELNAEVAKRYNNIGVIYARRKEHEKALEYFQKSLSIRQQTLEADHPDFQTSYQNLGLVNQDIGGFETARNYFNRMVDHALAAFGPDHPNTADSYVTFGEAYFKQKDHRNALRYYQKAIVTAALDFQDSSIYANPSSPAAKSAPILLKALSGKAQAFAEFYSSSSSRLKDLEASLHTYQCAATLIEAMRRGYHREDSRLGFGENAAEIYDHAIRVANELYKLTGKSQYRQTAFSFIEQNKAAVLWQALSEARAKAFAGVPPQLLSEEKALQIDLASYETQLQKEKFKQAGRDSITIRDFEARLFYLRRNYEALLARLEKKYPKYYELKYQPRSVTISGLQEALEARTAFLEYALGDSTLHVVLITKNDFEVVAVPLGVGFREQIVAYHRALRKAEKQNFLELGANLHRRLIAPIAERLTAMQKLIIVPDRELFYLPFEALFDTDAAQQSDAQYATATRFSELPFLIKKYEIVYHYSAALYLENAIRHAATKTTGDFIGFAPVFSESQNNGRILAAHRAAFDSSDGYAAMRSVTVDGIRLATLKHTEEEIEDILALFADTPHKSRGYFHQQASEENFKEEAGSYKYVHLATHSVINQKEPKLSGIVFSQPIDSNHAEDGMLYAAEAYHLKLQADLVTLSSCESGIGKLQEGEGMLALTRGFLYAGVPNLVFSLWKVYDQDARDLMVSFYGQLADGQSYANALRQAKLNMLADEATAFPISWAAFVLVGK